MKRAKLSEHHKEKRSIAMLVPTLGTHGGSVRVAVLLANHFAAQGHRVTLISRNKYDNVSFPLHERVTCTTLGFEGERLRSMVMDGCSLVHQALRDCQANVAFGIGTYETLMLLLPAHRLRVPVVFCDHGALINQWDDKKMRMVRWLSLRGSVKTVVLTQQSKNDYERLLHARPHQVVVIPNWIPHKMCDAGYAQSYNTSSKRLLWCGRLSHEKGVDHLIQIAAQVLPRHPDWTWDVVGAAADEAYAAEIAALIEQHGLTGRLNLCGSCSDMMSCYLQYAAVTLTSYREGLPLTLLEGLAFHLPLISFDVKTGPADIIEHGQNGWLVSPFDIEQYAAYLDQFIGDEVLRRRMSDASQQVIHKFDEHTILQAWDNLLDEVCQ